MPLVPVKEWTSENLKDRISGLQSARRSFYPSAPVNTGRMRAVAPSPVTPASGPRFIQAAGVYVERRHPTQRAPVVTPHYAVTITDQPAGRINRIRALQRFVAAAYGITVEQMVGPTRTLSLVGPRHVAIFLAREVLHMSFPEIGRRFNRDHTTALHAFGKVSGCIAADQEFARAMAGMRADLEAALKPAVVQIAADPAEPAEAEACNAT